MDIVNLAQIKRALDPAAAFAAIERGFAQYSAGETVVPPVGELLFDEPPGDMHIKYGYIRGDDHFVVKIATGFYRNAELGIAPQTGLMLVFRQRTGELETILLDEGFLTDVRTAIAGAIAAKYLAPRVIEWIGIIGTGQQARLQIKYLRNVVTCTNILVWGRSPAAVAAYRDEMERSGFTVESAADIPSLVDRCRLIVTATPSRTPLVDTLRPGTHLTAVGADTADKNEVRASVLARADLIVADSISQCRERGEIRHALTAGALDASRLVELGNIVRGLHSGRTTPDQVTIADLTGVAVQDIQIARTVLDSLRQQVEVT